LLVEDEGRVRELAREILAAAGYAVIEAGEPEAALRAGREHRGTIHLLITDLVMPKMRGQELAQRLGPGRPAMKVLFMSGHTPIYHGFPVQDAPFLQKPFTPDDLLRKVRELLDG
jgi:DNA-binding NtrC family response regulator